MQTFNKHLAFLEAKYRDNAKVVQFLFEQFFGSTELENGFEQKFYNILAFSYTIPVKYT